VRAVAQQVMNEQMRTGRVQAVTELDGQVVIDEIMKRMGAYK